MDVKILDEPVSIDELKNRSRGVDDEAVRREIVGIVAEWVRRLPSLYKSNSIYD